MSILNTFNQRLAAIRSFMWPQYQPERYYMRGPGPACARRGGEAPFSQGQRTV